MHNTAHLCRKTHK